MTTPTEGTPTPAEQAPEAAPADASHTPAPPADDPWAWLPSDKAWVKKELDKARDDAAKYRIERNDLRTQLSNASSPEEVAALRKQVAELEINSRREAAAAKHGLPSELIEFLTATDEAGLEAQAAKLARPAAPAQPDPVVVTQLPPSGGATPLADPNAAPSGVDEYRRWKEANPGPLS